MSFRRIAALAGVLFVVLIIINAALLGSQPGPDEVTQEVLDYLADNEDVHKVGSYIGFLVIVPAVVFFAGLIKIVRESDAEHDEAWGTVVLLSAVFMGATAMTGSALLGALLLRGQKNVAPETVQGLWDAQWVAFASGGAAVTALAASVAVPVLLHGLFPKWYALVSAVVAALGLVMLAATVVRSSGLALLLPGIFAFMIWVLITSYLMYREPAPSPSMGA